MTLTTRITNKKEELAKILNRKAILENEIADLEDRLASVKINNPDACMNPAYPVDSGLGCVGCWFEVGCSYKGKYKEFKMRG